MKKRIFSIILITILLIAYTLPVCAAEPPGTGLPGTSLYDNLFFKNTVNINTENEETYYYFLGTEETYAQASDVRVYPIYSDNSAYLSYEEKRIIGIFFLSSSELNSIGITIAQKDETGQYVKPSERSFSISMKLPDYKSLTTYDSYWSSYLAQFGIDTDEEYTQFYEEYSGYYYGIYDLSNGYKKNTYLRESVNESGEMIIHPLNADGSKYDDTSISTLTSSRFNFSSTGSHYYFPPFLFTDLMSDEDGDGNGNGSGSDDGSDSDEDDGKLPTLNIRIETEHYWVGIARRYRWDFIWNYEDYQIYKDNPSFYNIEVRYIRGKQKGFINALNNDIVPDDSLEWTNQYSYTDNYSVSKNLYSAYQKYILDTYGQGFFGTSPCIFDIRVVSADGMLSSNWVRVTTNSAYGTAFKIDEVDDNGNVTNKWLNGQDTYPDGTSVDNEVTDFTASNPDMSENTDEDSNSNNDVNISNVIGTLRSLISSIGQLPELASRCLLFLPDSFISLIMASLSLLVVVSIIKWFR